MMPPKKSKAARSVGQEEEGEEKKEEEPKVQEEQEEQEHFNIFDVVLVGGKRARTTPPGEDYMKKWILDNLVEKAGQHVSTGDCYDYYISECVSKGEKALAFHIFAKGLKDTFKSGSDLKEGSSYTGLIRIKREKKAGEKPVKTKSTTHSDGKKLKEVVTEIVTSLGNPKQGLGFSSLKKLINVKYPSMNMDKRTGFLLGFLDRSVHYGHLELVKGVGKCGYYRLFGASTKDEEEKDDKKKKTEVKENGEAEKTDGEKSGENAEKPKDTDGETSNTEDSKDEDKEEKEDKKEDKKEEDAGENKKRKRKAPEKGKKKKAAPSKRYRSFVVHSDPERIEDTFQLAMTFMVEPKEASSNKILRYITDYYDDDMTRDKLQKCLESGVEKGYWGRLTGQGFSGTFQLQMNEFDPSADDDLVGMVTNALVACTEPKQCSVTLLRGYLMEYHRNFGIHENINKFKKALERAEKKDIIRRITGIGCSGSFQLSKPFTPTPLILRGEDQDDDYESETDDEAPRRKTKHEEEVNEGYGNFKISSFQDAYVPRPSKRHGHGRHASTGAAAPVSKSGGKFRSTAARTGKKSMYTDDDEADGKRKRKSTQGKARKAGDRGSPRKSSKVSYRDDSSDDDDEAIPAPKKRGAPADRKAPQKSTKSAKSKKAAPKKGAKKPQKVEESESEDEAPPPPKKTSKKVEESESEAPSEDEAPPPPKKSSPKKKAAPKRKPSPKKVARKPVESESEKEDEDEEDSPPAKKARGGSKPATPATGRSKRAAATDSMKKMRQSMDDDDDVDDSDDEAPAAKRNLFKGKSKARKGKGRKR